jgi:hypothetical protein
MSTTATDQWRVYAVGDCDWWMGRSVDEVKEDVIIECGECDDEPRQLTAKEMHRLKYSIDDIDIVCECGAKLNELSPDWRYEGDAWGHYHGYPIGHVSVPRFRTFADELARRIKEGPKVELFATTEL